MASSSDRLSPHQQALMAMLDQAAAQLGLDRGAIQRAKQQVAMIPPDRVAAALQKVAVRTQPRPLRGPVSPSRPPEMGRGDERMMNEFAKIQDQRTLFSKDTRTPGTFRSRGAASTLPPAKADEPYRGEKPILVEPRRYEKKRELGENVMKTVRAEKEKERLLRLKWEVLRGKRPEPKKRTWIDEPPEERGMGELGAAKRELHEAKDRAHGLGSGPDDPMPAPIGKRLGPDERKMLTLKKDNDWTRAREEMENMEARTITVDKAFEELNETREGDRADAAKGLTKHERRPVDQKDPERAAWQTKLREISDNRKPMPEAERRAKFEKVATEEYRKVPWKKQSKYVADMMNEATLIDNELAKSLVEKNPAMGKTFIGRLAFFVEQNPNDVDAKAALEQARKGNFGAAVAYNRAGFSVKMGNKDFERSARHQAESAEKTQGRFATRETIEGRDELDRGEENRGDSEAVEKGRKKDLSQVDQEGAAAAKYEQDLDKERPGRNVYTKGDLDLEGTDKALERKYAAESPSKKKAFLWDRKNKRPYLAGPAKKRVESQVTEEMAYELSRVSKKKMAAALREEPMLFKVAKALLKRGH